MVSDCPNCGKNLVDEDAVYCPSCSKTLKEPPVIKATLTIAAGIMTIMVACASMIFGILSIDVFLWTSSDYLYQAIDFTEYGFLLAVLFCLIAFELGLLGGIALLRRKRFALSIIGVCFILVLGVANVLAMVLAGRHWTAFLLFGLPLIFLSTLSIVLIAVSRKELT